MTSRARGQWILLSLLVVSVTINYIDRGNLSIAASRLSGELQIGPEKIGLLLSSFFWTYAAMQIVSGWLIDRFSVYWIFAGGFFIWSAATALTKPVAPTTAALRTRVAANLAMESAKEWDWAFMVLFRIA